MAFLWIAAFGILIRHVNKNTKLFGRHKCFILIKKYVRKKG
jgi:hypothetical protein